MVKSVMVKRVLTSILAATFLFVGITSCNKATGPASSESKSVSASVSASVSQANPKDVTGKIEFMTYRDDLLLTWYPDALKDFSTKYPNVTVTTSTSKNFQQDLNIRMSANNLPDVFTCTGDALSDAQRSQYFLALNEVFPELVNVWQFNDANKNQDNGLTYALTYGGQGIGLAYNKKIFTALKLTPPKTIDELIATAKIIKASGKDMIGYAGCLKESWISQAYTLTAQAVMGKDQLSTYQAMMKSDAPFTADSVWGKMALTYKKICDAGVMEADPASMAWEPYLKLCGTGKVGMTLTWSTIPIVWPGRGDGSVTNDDLGYVPFPYDNSGGPYNTIMMPDWGLAISKSSKNAEAAKAFFKWHMNDKYGSYTATNAIVSARSDITTDIGYLKEFYNTNKPVIVTAIKTPTDFKTILDTAQMTIYDQFTLIALGKSVEEEFGTMNAAWKAAKK